jgi:hypothetical protein
VPNLTRLETFGETATQWLRVTVDPGKPGVFSWEPQTVPTPRHIGNSADPGTALF